MNEIFISKIDGTDYYWNNNRYELEFHGRYVKVNFEDYPLGFENVLEELRDRKLWEYGWLDVRDAA